MTDFWTRENKLEMERNVLLTLLFTIHNKLYCSNFNVNHYIKDELERLVREGKVTTQLEVLVKQYFEDRKHLYPTKEEVDAIELDY